MDKKSFIRGFGIGVIFAVVILGVSCLIRTSDSETISRAKKLGMVFKTDESKIEFSKASSGSAAEVNIDEDKSVNKSDKNKDIGSGEDKTKDTVSDNTGNTDKEEYEKEKDKLEDNADAIKKNLVINYGDWSGKISQELQELGVIDDAASFDKYLMDNGYSNRINTGSYEVSPDDTFDELAKKITAGYNNRNGQVAER